jgi:predicted RNA binding protein YcfA (HicA-like mRNA interferase family)
MSKKKSLNECRSGKDFLSFAESNGATIRNGKGSHFIVQTDLGSCAVPYHANEQLGNGLRCKIIKIFTLIGLGAIIIMAYLYCM